MNNYRKKLRDKRKHRLPSAQRGSLSTLCVLFFLLASCSAPNPSEITPQNNRATPSSTPQLSSAQTDPEPSHSFPNCQPVISPYFTKDALPFLIIPNPRSSEQALAPLASQYGIHIGAAVSAKLLKDESYASLLASQFSMVTPEVDMKWENIHPEPEKFDFSKGDTIVAFARLHQMQVYGHVLIWDLQLPEWITSGQYSRDQWIQILCKHVKSVVRHYRGQVYAWDVVNEALDENGNLRDTIWMRNIGPEYIPMAFHWAHEADPNALLVYNDFMAEGMNPKAEGVYTLIQEMLRKNVPIHAVGLQMHTYLDGPPPYHELLENMQRLSELGLSIFITEMDVKLQYSEAEPSEKLLQQAQMYQQVFSACLKTPNCRGFSTWGLTDLYSWIPDYTGKDDAPLLFDRKGQPKPAYHAITDLLQNP